MFFRPTVVGRTYMLRGASEPLFSVHSEYAWDSMADHKGVPGGAEALTPPPAPAAGAAPASRRPGIVEGAEAEAAHFVTNNASFLRGRSKTRWQLRLSRCAAVLAPHICRPAQWLGRKQTGHDRRIRMTQDPDAGPQPAPLSSRGFGSRAVPPVTVVPRWQHGQRLLTE
jgi:hypothetical protein